jgi:hypothetical protein
MMTTLWFIQYVRVPFFCFSKMVSFFFISLDRYVVCNMAQSVTPKDIYLQCLKQKF